MVLVTLVVGALATSCSHEVKPDHKGVFLVVGDALHELKPVTLDMEFTQEGFAISSFVGDPAVTVRPGDFYFMVYGDFRPFDLKVFTTRNGKWEEDSSQGSLAGNLQVGGVEGESAMLRCRVTKALAPGVYALAVQQGDATLYFPFRKAE